MLRTNSTKNNNAPAITKAGFLILAFLIFSFAYELPLFDLTGKDRTNPRLFDLAAIILVLYWLITGRQRGWKINLKNRITRPWLYLTYAFCFAAIISFIHVPLSKYIYSIFYLIKYTEVLVVVLIFSSAPFDKTTKKRILWISAIASIWVAVYAIMQHLGYVSTVRYLPNNEEIPAMEGALNSTLGNNYFHLGMYSVLSGLIGFSLLVSSKSISAKIFAITIIILNVSAAVLSGSKAALIGMVLAIFLSVFLGKYKSKVSVAFAAVCCLSILAYIYTGSLVKNRLESGHGGTPYERLLHGFRTLDQAYDANGVKIILIGGGFYVTPLKDASGDLKYRIGYGNHNVYLFPLEQAGIIAFVFALYFWFSAYKGLRIGRKWLPRSGLDFSFSSSMYIFLIVLMIVGIAGQVFFIGFNTEHFTVYILLLFILAMERTESTVEENKAPREKTSHPMLR